MEETLNILRNNFKNSKKQKRKAARALKQFYAGAKWPVVARLLIWRLQPIRYAVLAGISVAVVASPFLVLSLAERIYRELPTHDLISAIPGRTLLTVESTGSSISLIEVKAPIRANGVTPHCKEAVVGREDRFFYHHPGFNPISMLKGVMGSLWGDRIRGGSGITQQVAKNLWLSPAGSLERKFKEIVLAVKLEDHFSKEQILAMYLDLASFGNGAVGIEAAARVHFGKEAKALTEFECLILAASLRNPEGLNYSDHPQRAVNAAERLRNVLAFRADGELDWKKVSPYRPTKGKRLLHRIDAQSLLDALRPEIRTHLSGKQGRFVVVTTINAEMQVYAERTIQQYAKQLDARRADRGALVTMRHNGEVLAMVPTVNRRHSQLDHVSSIQRPFASVFKPLVYYAAFENGVLPSTKVPGTRIDIQGWRPKNDGDHYPEAVRLDDALAFSINTATVRVQEYLAGRVRVHALINRLGLNDQATRQPGLALGQVFGSPIEVGRMYAIIANGGHAVAPYRVRASYSIGMEIGCLEVHLVEEKVQWQWMKQLRNESLLK